MKTPEQKRRAFGKHFGEVLQARRKEADGFYGSVIPKSLDADATNIMRQALAGMLWSKQFFYFDVNRWLEERGSDPYSPSAKQAGAEFSEIVAELYLVAQPQGPLRQEHVRRRIPQPGQISHRQTNKHKTVKRKIQL